MAQDWPSALKTCVNLTLAGRTWRLPSVNELSSLVDKSKLSPSIDTAVFPATVPAYYWSSTTYIVSVTDAWAANFNGGYSINAIKTGNSYVRCVSGP